MPRKEQLYHYPEGREKIAFNVIDSFLSNYASEEYRKSLKSMVKDQIGAMKYPLFIAQTVFDFIKFEIEYRYTDMEIPDAILVALKQNLASALEGIEL